MGSSRIIHLLAVARLSPCSAALLKQPMSIFIMENMVRGLSSDSRLELQAARSVEPQWLTSYKKLLQKLKCEGLNSLEDRYIPLTSNKGKSKRSIARKFVDYRRIVVHGGNGGSGAISFLQLLCNPNAGPDGGDGGNGGHIIFRSSSSLRSLDHFPSIIRGIHGEDGSGNKCHGKNGDNTVIEIPVGTVFKVNREEVASLEAEGALFLAAKGGAGGKGNCFFTTSVDQAPKIAEYGGQGESFKYDVELRIMADVGLVGFPNAGKSTLLQAISRAKPKVAAYPFTTLNPYVGMVQYGDFFQLAVADIPGLIEGAHKNHGLGFSFLRHIERCSGLLYVIDASQPHPWHQFEILQSELEAYHKGLSQRPHAVVANKMDLIEAQENLEEMRQRINFPILPISAKMGDHLLPLLVILRLLTEVKHKLTASGSLEMDKDPLETE